MQRIAGATAAPLTGVPFAYKDIYCTEGLAHHVRLEACWTTSSPLRCARRRAAQRARARWRSARPTWTSSPWARRTRTRTSDRCATRGTGTRAGRLLGRLGRRGGRAPRAGGDRHRHRRLDPPARGVVRRVRPQARPTAGLPLRHGRVRFDPRPGRADRAQRRGLALLLNVMAGLDARDSTSVERPEGGLRGAILRPPLQGLRVGVPKEYFGEGIDPTCARRSRRRSRSSSKRARSWSKSRCPTPRRGRRVLRHRAGRSLVEPLALRRRALRPPRQGVQRPDRHVLPHARGGLRRRGQAPHPDRHVRALARLLRCVLPAGAEDPAADRAGLSRRRSRKCDVIIGPTAPTTSRSSSARRPHDPVQMYLAISSPSRRISPACRRMSIPCGFDSAGLPVGLQLMGGHFSRGAAARRRASLPAGDGLAPASADGDAAVKWLTGIAFSYAGGLRRCSGEIRTA